MQLRRSPNIIFKTASLKASRPIPKLKSSTLFDAALWKANNYTMAGAFAQANKERDHEVNQAGLVAQQQRVINYIT